MTEQRWCTSAADTFDHAAAAPDRDVRGAAGDRSRARAWATRRTTADGRACRSSRRPTTHRRRRRRRARSPVRLGQRPSTGGPPLALALALTPCRRCRHRRCRRCRCRCRRRRLFQTAILQEDGRWHHQKFDTDPLSIINPLLHPLLGRVVRSSPGRMPHRAGRSCCCAVLAGFRGVEVGLGGFWWGSVGFGAAVQLSGESISWPAHDGWDVGELGRRVVWCGGRRNCRRCQRSARRGAPTAPSNERGASTPRSSRFALAVALAPAPVPVSATTPTDDAQGDRSAF